jgi:hypothetical protein
MVSIAPGRFREMALRTMCSNISSHDTISGFEKSRPLTLAVGVATAASSGAFLDLAVAFFLAKTLFFGGSSFSEPRE